MRRAIVKLTVDSFPVSNQLAELVFGAVFHFPHGNQWECGELPLNSDCTAIMYVQNVPSLRADLKKYILNSQAMSMGRRMYGCVSALSTQS